MCNSFIFLAYSLKCHQSDGPVKIPSEKTENCPSDRNAACIISYNPVSQEMKFACVNQEMAGKTIPACVQNPGNFSMAYICNTNGCNNPGQAEAACGNPHESGMKKLNQQFI